MRRLKKLNLEVYYNGDGSMTEFKIKCYKKSGDKVEVYRYLHPRFPDLEAERR